MRDSDLQSENGETGGRGLKVGVTNVGWVDVGYYQLKLAYPGTQSHEKPWEAPPLTLLTG